MNLAMSTLNYICAAPPVAPIPMHVLLTQKATAAATMFCYQFMHYDSGEG